MTENCKTAPLLIAANEIFDFLHGKEYILHGIHGIFEYKATFSRYLNRWEHSLYHNPSEIGQQTEEYRKTRRKLGDDWTTDLTNNIESYCAIATKLGYIYNP